MKVETMIKLRNLGITQKYLKFAVVKELPETRKKDYTYIRACDERVWIYCKAPDESAERWHDLGSIDDFKEDKPRMRYCPYCGERLDGDL